MCEPTTIMIGLSALSTGLAVVGQLENANAQADSLEDSARLQNEALEQQYDQMQKQGTEEVSQVARQAMVEQARMRVAAGESGIAGNTVDGIFGNAEFNAAEAVSGIQRNVRNTKDQSALEGKGMYAASKSKANSIKQPDWIGAGLQIGGQVAGKWGDLKAEWTKPATGGSGAQLAGFGGTAADPWYG